MRRPGDAVGADERPERTAMDTEATSTDEEPSDTMQRRGEESTLKLWILLEANRWAVAAAVLCVFVLGTLGSAAVLPHRVLLESGDPVETLFQALVTATVTSVTLVVSINSLVLSQELGPLGDQRERMEGAMSFRRDVEDELGIDVAAPTPAAFLRELVAAVGERARSLSAAADADRSDDVERVADYAGDLRRHADSVEAELEGEEFGTFGVLSAALNFNYSWKIYEARKLRALFADGDEPTTTDGATTESTTTDGATDGTTTEPTTTDGATDGTTTEPTTTDKSTGERDASDTPESRRDLSAALDDVVAVLMLFGPAREHVKTLYFQWELVDLSRAMLYSGVPALLVGTNLLLFHGALSGFLATALGLPHYVWIVAVAAAVTIAPFAVLLSFVLRIGTVAKRTLSIEPLILRTTGADGDDRGS
ncbi:hypothetical protein [Halobellus ordinarius]|uniref:hypothetical protein n=1 Tax=Halobellus ordinarius TaxID=3075120 RepID=UPI00288058F7|nr:hypothetical protein [Halobellus sp. ZY16]